MQKRSVRSLYRRLALLFVLALSLGALTSPADAYIEYSGCGEPYTMTTRHCTAWGWYCWNTVRGCADCDQGTACYNI